MAKLLGELAELAQLVGPRVAVGDVGQKFSASFSPPLTVRLLVLQPTPFCNLDCDYCYLPNRDTAGRMSQEVVEATIQNVVDSHLLGQSLSVIWHAGEPLVVPPTFYSAAFETFERVVAGRAPIQHSLQTNGTLIDDAWCDLFLSHDVRVGVSIDGPAFIHDRHRKTRAGKGTFDATLRGVRRLQARGIRFHVITVITADSLHHVSAMAEFFKSEGIVDVGFNVDEAEGPHGDSTMAARHESFGRFLKDIRDLADRLGSPLHIRELQGATAAILEGLSTVVVKGERYPDNVQAIPLAITSVDWRGNVSTFSPELLGQEPRAGHVFVLGNVTSERLVDMLDNPAFIRLYRDILEGVRNCRDRCQYFSLCGGGAPVNKMYETGSFTTTETAYCRNVVQAPIQVQLEALEA
ncbi:MAG: cyclophane-forming radical SAM/SPASM peptide maturase GrrM/OscB [Gammaproteobacteria bacterium]